MRYSTDDDGARCSPREGARRACPAGAPQDRSRWESFTTPRRLAERRSWCATVPATIACLAGCSASTQTAREVRGAAAVEPLPDEPPAKTVIDPPLPDPLSRGRVVVQYRTENLHVVPVFGPAALAVSPRVVHVHVTVDGATWQWADASGNPVIINGLAPGQHRVLSQLVNANHQPIDQGTVELTVPATQPGS